MANEIILNQVPNALDIKALIESKANAIIELMVKAKPVKLAKIEFNSIKAYMYLDCYNEKGEYEGKKSRWIDVHINQEAFNDNVKVENSNVNKPNDVVTGSLYVYARYVQKPNKYMVKDKLDENGKPVLDEKGNVKKEYPKIYIKGGIIGCVPYSPSQEDFTRPKQEQKVIDVKVNDSTGEVLEG